MKIRFPVLIGVGVAALLPIVIPLCCSGDEFLDDAMERYDFASWAGATNAAYANRIQLMEIKMNFATNVLSAQTELMQYFADLTSVRQHSVTNGLAGDRCYCLTLSNGFSCVEFTRNNVFVDIATYTNSLSAFDIAVQLDAAILNASTNAPGR